MDSLKIGGTDDLFKLMGFDKKFNILDEQSEVGIAIAVANAESGNAELGNTRNTAALARARSVGSRPPSQIDDESQDDDESTQASSTNSQSEESRVSVVCSLDPSPTGEVVVSFKVEV